MRLFRFKNDQLERDMHAIIKSGGKQYRVTKGQIIRLEKLDLPVDEAVNFDQVLMVTEGENVQVGAPHVTGASVAGKVLSHGREKKIHILKFKRRKHHMKQMGHRQYYTEVEITAVAA